MYVFGEVRGEEESQLTQETHSGREIHAGRGVHAGRVAFTARDHYAGRTVYAGRGLHAGQGLTHRWPRLVRETAVERWRVPGGGGERATEPLDPPDPSPELADLRAEDARADTTVTDPQDELFLLGERCAQAYIEADALHYRAMKLLAEFHEKNGWEDTGFGSTAEWLAYRIGIQPGAARERLRTALALEQLPETSAAMRRGELSFTKVRALTRVATPDNETTLLEFARAGSAANLERVVRGWKALDRKSEVRAEQIRHRSRRFSAWVDEDGMVVVKGRLDPEVGALLMRAVEAASDALYREDAEDDLDPPKPEQRRADAVGLLAERALAAGFGGRSGKSDGKGSEPGFGDSGEAKVPISGSRAERYQVMLHVDAGTLKEDGEAGRSELEDGTRVSAEVGIHFALLPTTCCGLCSGSDRKAKHPFGQLAERGGRTAARGLAMFAG